MSYHFKGDKNQPEMKKVDPKEALYKEQKAEIKISLHQMQTLRKKYNLPFNRTWSDQLQFLINQLT